VEQGTLIALPSPLSQLSRPTATTRWLWGLNRRVWRLKR